MLGPKCKFCGQPHFGLCTNIKKSRIADLAKAKADEIAARPVKLGAKGKAKKAKRAKKRPAKPAAAPAPAPAPAPEKA